MYALWVRGKGRLALEVGPLNSRVFGAYLRDRGWRYESLDRWRSGNPSDQRGVGFVDHEASLTDLSLFGDDRFDLFMCQHVIEEITEYEAALSEIARVLKPRGIALMEVPFDSRLAISEPQPKDHFGNVWRFGADLPEKVAQYFDRVEQLPLREATYEGTLLACVR